MSKNDAETGCSKRWPEKCKGKEKEVTGRTSEAGANFGPRRTEWEEAYLPLKGGTLLAPGSASANSPRAPAGLPWDEFNQLFDDSKRHRKITDFSNPQKTYKVIESTAFLTSKEGFSCKNHDFWVPFCYRFLPVLGKWQKCVISEEYNAKRVSEPSKNSKNRIDFSLNLHAFLKPLPKTILEVSKCQSMLKS